MSDDNEHLRDLIASGIDRRGFLRGAAAAAAGTALPAAALGAPERREASDSSTLDFSDAPAAVRPELRIADGYDWEVVVGWGDPIVEGEEAFDPDALDAAGQSRRFGYNNDYLAFLPLPFESRSSERGLLCVNHEYVNPELVWSDIERSEIPQSMTESRVATALAAHGHTVLEVRRRGDSWQPVLDGEYNRRITALETEMRLTGPAAGHERLQTEQDPSGRRVVGTLGNCAGGVTPWGTVLIAEENFDDYFGGSPSDARLARDLERLGHDPESWYGFERHRRRFDVGEVPGEINRFGWIVEYDPRDPEWTPRKRTALGRFKHEGATMAMNADGRVVLYSGDDEAFEHLYRWVSDAEYDPTDRAANLSLLDGGTLYVAKFRGDGTVRWLPLEYGTGPLTEANDFHGQADVLIETRRAAELVGATELDRPEDAEVDPHTGRLYVTLTNNAQRESTDVASPRAPNLHGHVVELIPPYGARRHSAETFRWNYFLLGGDPSEPDLKTQYHPKTSGQGWLTCPDNLTFDRRGHIWIASDQGSFQRETGVADGLFASDMTGPGRALTRRLISVPVGAEATGPYFTPDEETLFLCVQHPGEYSTRDDPETRWPDFDEKMPPRPAVVAIRRREGGPVGG